MVMAKLWMYLLSLNCILKNGKYRDLNINKLNIKNQY